MAAKKRRHNTTAQRAHQKNLADAKYKAKVTKRNEFLQKYRKQLMIGIPALIVVIIGVWLLCKATIGPGGSIPNFFGNLQGVEDNWIVTNQGTSKSPRYYKMGEFTAPEGYTLDPDYTVTSDPIEHTLYFLADDEKAPVHSIYVSGIRNKTAAEIMDSVGGNVVNATGGTRGDTPIGGHEAVWGITRINDDQNATQDSELVIGHAQLTVYVDSIKNASVLVFMNSTSNTPADEIPSDEVMLAEAEKIVAGLTLPQ